MRLSAATRDLFNRVADGIQSEDDERQLAALLSAMTLPARNSSG